jgi:hypothetical protein
MELISMRKVVFGAVFMLAMTSCSLAQDFNPGTVVGNVFQNPASGCGCGYGLGCCPPGYTQYPHTSVYRHGARRKVRHEVAVQH